MSDTLNEQTPSRGILYIATDDEYLEEARESAARVSELMDHPIAVIAHRDVDDPVFDHVIIDDSPTETFAEKPRNFRRTPFDETLYLDTDTYLVDDVSELFDVLEGHDLAVAPSQSNDLVQGVPAPRTQYNTGVVSYGSNEAVREFFSNWERIYQEWHDERGIVEDQPSFLKAVYESDMDVFTLSIRYNIRLFSPGAIQGDAKIVHGRSNTGIENAAQLINGSSKFRAFFRNSYLSQSGAFKVVEDASLRYHLEKSIAERGVKQTLLDAPRYLKNRVL